MASAKWSQSKQVNEHHYTGETTIKVAGKSEQYRHDMGYIPDLDWWTKKHNNAWDQEPHLQQEKITVNQATTHILNIDAYNSRIILDSFGNDITKYVKQDILVLPNETCLRTLAINAIKWLMSMFQPPPTERKMGHNRPTGIIKPNLRYEKVSTIARKAVKLLTVTVQRMTITVL